MNESRADEKPLHRVATESEMTVFKNFFFQDIRRTLSDGGVPKEVGELVVSSLWETFEFARKDLGVDFPLKIRPSELLDTATLYEEGSDAITMAYFVPHPPDSTISFGEIVLNKNVLVAYSKTLERKGGGRPFTPWKLMSDVAHEMRHAGQHQEDVERVLADRKYPYDSQVIELEAREYSLDVLQRQQTWGVLDRIERAFVMSDLKREIKRFRKNVRNRDLV